ncbi:MAG: xseA, partial [Rhizobium sp.]|nr:xseA [Rhizobium sp.]
PTGAAEMAVPVKADLEAQVANLTARLSGSMNRQMDGRRRELRDLMRALPSIDQLLALPRRRFDEVAARLDRGLELTALNKRRMLEKAASQLRPNVLASRINERRQRVSEQMLKADRVLERMIDRMQARLARADAVFAGLPARLSGETGRARERLANISHRSDTALDIFLRRERSALSAHDRILQSLSYKNVLKRGYAVIRNDDDHVLSSAGAVADGSTISIEFGDGRVKAIAGASDAPGPSSAKKKIVAKPPAPNQGSLF